jgi:hypothetical protein
MAVAKTRRTKPQLWEKVKKSVLRSPKGGVSGKWSARKAQLAVAMYKKKGGGYYGKKSPSNSLTRWTREDWGYISDTKKNKKKSVRKTKKKSVRKGKAKSLRKSVKKSKTKGRYLPKKVRDQLSDSEKKKENRLKGTKRGKWIPYSESVRKKMSSYLKKSLRR